MREAWLSSATLGVYIHVRADIRILMSPMTSNSKNVGLYQAVTTSAAARAPSQQRSDQTS